MDKSFKRNGTLYSFKIPLYKALKRKNSGAAWQTPSQSIAVTIISSGTP